LGISLALSHLALVAAETGDSDLARQLLEESISIERGAGLRPGLAGSLEVSAKLAIDDGCLARAARLYACASVRRDADGGSLMEVGWPDPAPRIAQIRATLGEEAFAEAWRVGRAMSLADSAAYALEERVPDGAPPRLEEVFRLD
jgi:hypothetical protein